MALLNARVDGALIGVYNTGTGAPGSADPHYKVISSADTNYLGPLTYVSTAMPGSYLPNNSTSSWIGLTANEDINLAAGYYDYQTTFDLTGLDPSAVVLTGRWSSDNESTIYLNGVTTGYSLGATPYGSLTGFTIDSDFVAGVNDLDFIVHNDGAESNLRVEISGSVPEPALLGLISASAVGVLGRRRRAL